MEVQFVTIYVHEGFNMRYLGRSKALTIGVITQVAPTTTHFFDLAVQSNSPLEYYTYTIAHMKIPSMERKTTYKTSAFVTIIGASKAIGFTSLLLHLAREGESWARKRESYSSSKDS